jgi:hypothetical protein
VPYLKLYSRSRPEGVHSGRNHVFSDRRFACIGCGKPCGPYRVSPWRWPAASSSAKLPVCQDLSPRAERRSAEDSWDSGSGNLEAADRPRRPRPAGSGWATERKPRRRPAGSGFRRPEGFDRFSFAIFPCLTEFGAPARRMTVRSLCWKRTSAAKLAKEGSETLVLFCLSTS